MVFDLAESRAIFPSTPFGSRSGACNFCAAVSKRRCTVFTSAGRLPAPFSQRPTEPVITGGGAVGTLSGATVKARDRTRKVGFPASNASSFFARAIRSLRVCFARRGFFFGFVFRETFEGALLRFDGRFFLGIVYWV